MVTKKRHGCFGTHPRSKTRCLSSPKEGRIDFAFLLRFGPMVQRSRAEHCADRRSAARYRSAISDSVSEGTLRLRLLERAKQRFVVVRGSFVHYPVPGTLEGLVTCVGPKGAQHRRLLVASMTDYLVIGARDH